MTSGEVDATFDATVSRTAVITAELVGAVKQEERVMKADLELTPKAVKKDMFCGVTVRVTVHREVEEKNHKYAYLYASGVKAKSVVTVTANSTEKVKVTSLSNNEYVNLKGEDLFMAVSEPFAVCAESKQAAIDLLNACVAPIQTNDANFSKECPVNPIQ